MKVLTIKLTYGENEFTTIVRPPSSAHEYLRALAHLTLGINDVAEKWSQDARMEQWESWADQRNTVEEF